MQHKPPHASAQVWPVVVPLTLPSTQSTYALLPDSLDVLSQRTWNADAVGELELEGTREIVGEIVGADCQQVNERRVSHLTNKETIKSSKSTVQYSYCF